MGSWLESGRAVKFWKCSTNLQTIFEGSGQPLCFLVRIVGRPCRSPIDFEIY
jgi:hypothetical protein